MSVLLPQGLDPAARLTAQDRTGMVRRLPVSLWERLQEACSGVVSLGPRNVVTRAGEPLSYSALLLDGLMARHITDDAGRRQMVALQVPGDFVDLHGLPLGRLDHDVSTMSEVRLALFPHDALETIMSESADHARALWSLTMIDASIHRHWAFRLGRLRAMAGMANFLCEMTLRMELCGRLSETGFGLPLTQPDLADICGLSPMHVHRVLRDLREAGCCSLRDGHVTVTDRAMLRKLGNFEPQYLFLPWEPETD